MATTRRLPISARHAFALAIDLAARRDPLHSLVVPLVVRAPWILAPVLVPLAWPAIRQDQTILVRAGSELLDFLAFVVLTAMLRFRARSVYKAGPAALPARVGECYRLGMRRVPMLYLTEALRNVVLTLSLPLVFPFIWIAFKLSLATESVVLRERNPIQASLRSFHLTESRFERWLEMIVMTVLLIVPFWFLMAVGYLTVPGGFDLWYAVGKLVTAALVPVVQYAWTFFYLRLEEADEAGVEVGTLPGEAGASVAAWRAAAARPTHLRLVESPRGEPDGEPPGS